METKELLGRRIKELRRKRGLTQERLAERANLDVKYVGNIERGKENPTVATLERLAGALSVKMDQLLSFGHQIQGERQLRRRIIQILNKCDEKELQLILRMIGGIKD